MDVSLTSWLSRPRPGRGLHLADDGGGWLFWEYPDLATLSLRAAGGLVAEGVRPGDVVCLVLQTDQVCLAALYGVWAAGATACLVVPPAFQEEGEYVAHVAQILSQAEPALVVTTDQLAPLVGRAMTRAGRPGLPWPIRFAATSARVRPPADIALLQFTSGATGRPRGVRVTRRNLEANIAAILRWLGWQDGDGTASWLPLYHDMGLIGCFLTPVTAQGDLWLMRPDQFVRDPARWLRCFGAGVACHTAAPPFGYAYAARRIQPEAMHGIDLSGWRTAIVGAEAIDAGALERFARLTAPSGFSSRAFAPAYGLAEATLLVTGLGSGEVPRLARPDWSALRFGRPVDIAERDVLGGVGEHAAGGRVGWLMGCGYPCDAAQIAIVDQAGDPLPDGCLGEIVVTGQSVAAGYQGDPGGSTRWADRRLCTGDAGFMLAGELYVLGRMGDSLKIRGCSVYVEDLEVKVAAAAGLGRSRCVVIADPSAGAGGGQGGVAVLAEAVPGGWADAAADLISRELGADLPVRVIAGQRGLIKRTSSGKPRRRYLWEQLQSGRLGGTVVVRKNARL